MPESRARLREHRSSCARISTRFPSRRRSTRSSVTTASCATATRRSSAPTTRRGWPRSWRPRSISSRTPRFPTGASESASPLTRKWGLVRSTSMWPASGRPTPTRWMPAGAASVLTALQGKGVKLLALERVPRITRAQSMDVLSSQATVSGYKAVLLGAQALPKLLPMLSTAAGTLAPAKVFVIGAGVAGLQAIATARRLADDVRQGAGHRVRGACRPPRPPRALRGDGLLAAARHRQRPHRRKNATGQTNTSTQAGCPRKPSGLALRP